MGLGFDSLWLSFWAVYVTFWWSLGVQHRLAVSAISWFRVGFGFTLALGVV